MGMNVESGIQTDYTVYDYDDRGARRRRLIIIGGVIAAVVALGVIAMLVFGGEKPAPAKPAAPGVTVIVPGRTDIAATVSATGTLFAKREMPVGVAGEGGMIQSVAREGQTPGHEGCARPGLPPGKAVGFPGTTSAELEGRGPNRRPL